MSYTEPGPLPQWTPRGNGTYEVTRGDVCWQLRLEQDAAPPGWYLTCSASSENAQLVLEGCGNLYLALDLAGMCVAADAVRADPSGARRQLDLLK